MITRKIAYSATQTLYFPAIPVIGMSEEVAQFLQYSVSLEGKVVNAARLSEGNDKLLVLARGDRISEEHDLYRITFDKTEKTETIDQKLVPSGWQTFLHIITWGRNGAEAEMLQKREKFWEDVKYYKQVNMCGYSILELREKVRGIRLYQADMPQTAQQLGRKLEIVETGRDETFLRAMDDFSLKAHAFLLRANAIVSYQPGSCMGTPVRFL